MKSPETRYQALREPALRFMKEADRLEGQISLLELKRFEITRQLEGETDRAQTSNLVREYENLTAQMDALQRQQRDAYAKSEDWRQIARDMGEFAAEAQEKANQPS